MQFAQFHDLGTIFGGAHPFSFQYFTTLPQSSQQISYIKKRVPSHPHVLKIEILLKNIK